MRPPLALTTTLALAGLAACGAAAPAAPASSTPAVAPLCAFRAGGDADGQEFAPCLEGIRFAKSMREQGFSDYADYYTPGVAAETCARKTAGQPLSSQGATGSDVGVQLAYRQAEIAARCP
jgi:hypothetical protein